jgi:serine/threonine protein kinase
MELNKRPYLSQPKIDKVSKQDIDLETKLSIKPITKIGSIDSYETKKKLGQGGFGTVYEVVDKKTGIIYADKVLKNDSGDYTLPDLNELDMLCKMKHPNVLRAHDFFNNEKDNTFHIILPKADSDLWKYSPTKNVLKKNLSLNEAIFMMYQIISGVSFLHKQGYFHCDIKPENVLMFGDKPVISDFGWTYAKGYDTSEICGTITFVAPQCTSPKLSTTLSPYKDNCNQIQSDIFGLGVLFFYLLTGKELIPYDRNLDMVRANYSIVEKRLQNYIKSTAEPYVSMRSCFECIYKMCRLYEKDRIESISDVLTQPVFLSKNLDIPIPGLVEIPSVPDCKLISSYKFNQSNLIKQLYKLSCDVATSDYNARINLYELCILPSIVFRCISLFPLTMANIKNYSFVSMFIASSCAGKESGDLSTYSSLGIDKDTFFEMIIECIEGLKGCLTIPTVYNQTDNGLECLWYIFKCLYDCEFVFIHPEECHRQYLLFEEKNPICKQYRFNKMQKNIIDCDFRFPLNKVDITVQTLNNGEKYESFSISYDQSTFFQIT